MIIKNMEEAKIEKQISKQEMEREQLLEALEEDIKKALDETWAESKDAFLGKFLAKLRKASETTRVE